MSASLRSDLKGRTVVLTGGTGGLGRHLVQQFADFGARTVLVARDRRKAEDLVAGLSARSQVEVEQADLASQRSVRALGERLVRRPGGVAALVNNAGAMFGERLIDEDGIERSVAVNHLGPFLLTMLLLPALGGGAPASVVNLSTGSVAFGDLGDLQSQRKFTPNRSYGTAKLANLAATVELARRLDRSGERIRVVSVDPGLMRTGMGDDMPGFLGLFNRRLKRNSQPVAATAATVVRAATDHEATGGALLDFRGRPMKLPRKAREPSTQAREFVRASELLGLDTY